MSRELDAEVAEKVMGWWSVGIDTTNMLRNQIWADGKRKIYGFNPSEDIATAFEVVDSERRRDVLRILNDWQERLYAECKTSNL